MLNVDWAEQEIQKALNRRVAVEAAGRAYEGVVAAGKFDDARDNASRAVMVYEEMLRLAADLEGYLNNPL